MLPFEGRDLTLLLYSKFGWEREIKNFKVNDIELYFGDIYTDHAPRSPLEAPGNTSALYIGSIHNYHTVEISIETPEEQKKREKFMKQYDSYVSQVMQDGLKIKDVPAKFRDRNLYMIAVKENGLALEYAPRNFKFLSNYENYLLNKEAVMQNPLAIKYVLYNKKSYQFYEDIADLALDKDSSLLEFVAKEYKDSNHYKYRSE